MCARDERAATENDPLYFRGLTPVALNKTFLPGVLKTGLPEILSQVQHIAGNLSKRNLLKARILLV